VIIVALSTKQFVVGFSACSKRAEPVRTQPPLASFPQLPVSLLAHEIRKELAERGIRIAGDTAQSTGCCPTAILWQGIVLWPLDSGRNMVR